MSELTDADRQRAADALRAHFTAGRLDVEEFDSRLGAAWAARTRTDLDAVLADLPRLTDAPVAPPPGWGPGRAPGWEPDRGPGRAPGWEPGWGWEGRRRLVRRSACAHTRTFVTVMAMLVGIWALTGFGYFWPAWPMVFWGIFVIRHALWARRYEGELPRACGRGVRV